jgi:hypothetical protein
MDRGRGIILDPAILGSPKLPMAPVNLMAEAEESLTLGKQPHFLAY